jgi:hypothetical protein
MMQVNKLTNENLRNLVVARNTVKKMGSREEGIPAKLRLLQWLHETI